MDVCITDCIILKVQINERTHKEKANNNGTTSKCIQIQALQQNHPEMKKAQKANFKISKHKKNWVSITIYLLDQV